MAIASTGGAPPPSWLDTLGKVAGVILGLELVVLLLIMCGLMVGLVLAMRWLNTHVVPVLHENAPKAQHVMSIAEHNTERVVNGVAEFYGRRQAVRTGLRVLFFGRHSARRVHEDSLIQAATDLELMETEASDGASGENGATPHMGHQREPQDGAVTRPRTPRPIRGDQQSDGREGRNGYHAPDDEFSRMAGNAG
jgi:hypothetical protein